MLLALVIALALLPGAVTAVVRWRHRSAQWQPWPGSRRAGDDPFVAPDSGRAADRAVDANAWMRLGG